MTVFARSGERCPPIRSPGWVRIPQLGTNETTGPCRMKASLVWICSRLASSQNSTKTAPSSRQAKGLLPCREAGAGRGTACARGGYLACFIGLVLLLCGNGCPQYGLVRVALSRPIRDNRNMLAIGGGVTSPLTVYQSFGSTAVLALAHAPVGSSRRHPVMAQRPAGRVSTLYLVGGLFSRHSGFLSESG